MSKGEAIIGVKSVGDKFRYNKATLDAKYFGNKVNPSPVRAKLVEVMRTLSEISINLAPLTKPNKPEDNVKAVPISTTPVMHYATMQQKVTYITARIVDTLKLRGVKVEPSAVRDYIFNNAESFATEEDERFIQMSLSDLRAKGVLA
jgi:hypothetical protein